MQRTSPLRGAAADANVRSINKPGESSMDPITLAFSGAAIVQLIGVWRAESGVKAKDVNDLKEWLKEHNFDKYETILEQNIELSANIDRHLKEMDDRINGKLDELRLIIEKVLGNGGAESKKDIEINESLCRALVRMIDEEWVYISHSKHMTGQNLHGHPRGGKIEVKDEDWLHMEEDLETLSLYDYLREDYKEHQVNYHVARKLKSLVDEQIRGAI